MIGFEAKLITATEYAKNLPNITNSKDTINVHCDAIMDSLVNGQRRNTITVILTDNLTRLFSFSYQPRFLSYYPVSTLTLSKIRFYTTGSIERPVNLNGIEWYIDLFLKSTPID